MTIIPYTRETMKYSEEAILAAQKYYALKEEKQDFLKKEIEPLKRKYDNLRKDEIPKLKTNTEFIKYCEKIISKGHKITAKLYETWWDPNGSCGGETKEVDLVDKFADKEYHDKRKELIKDINEKYIEMNKKYKDIY